MATRKQAREAIIQILYAKELGNDKAIEQAEEFLHQQKIRNKQQDFALALLHGICSEEEHISDVINVFLKTWDLNRLGVIEKSIIKLGVYELLQTNTQKAVVINEAIELTKSFNVQDAFKLVNGLLDSIAKTDSKMLDDLIKKQTNVNRIEKLMQNSAQKTHTESKNIIQLKSNITQQPKTDSVKKTRLQKTMQKNIKECLKQNLQAKKTDMAHIKSIQIVTNNKNKNQQKLEQKTNLNTNEDFWSKKYGCVKKDTKHNKTNKILKDYKQVISTKDLKNVKNKDVEKNNRYKKGITKTILNKDTKNTSKKD